MKILTSYKVSLAVCSSINQTASWLQKQRVLTFIMLYLISICNSFAEIPFSGLLFLYLILNQQPRLWEQSWQRLLCVLDCCAQFSPAAFFSNDDNKKILMESSESKGVLYWKVMARGMDVGVKFAGIAVAPRRVNPGVRLPETPDRTLATVEEPPHSRVLLLAALLQARNVGPGRTPPDSSPELAGHLCGKLSWRGG